MINEDLTDLYLNAVSDRLTAEELVELLGLSTEDIIDAFFEKVLGNKKTQRIVGVNFSSED